jgi:uncharacterized membrane protein
MRIRRNVNDWERTASVAIGLGLLAWVMSGHRRDRGIALAAIGMVSRGLTGYCPVNAAVGRERHNVVSSREALAGRRGLRLSEGIRINRPPAEVYDFWRGLQNLPRFMSKIERVDVINERRSHWVMLGPAGATVEWDADIINDQRPDVIAWRSVGDADMASAGSVRFTSMADGGTQVDVLLQYNPPAGKAGAVLATLFGMSPDEVLREDLRHLKTLLESETPRPA